MEIWRAIHGYEGHYEVSDHGRIKSLKGRRERLLTPKVNKRRNGYLSVVLSLDGVPTTKTIHQLVARAFVDGYSPGLVVCHIDNNVINNHHLNLRWGTQKSNIDDMLAAGNHHQLKKDRCPYGHDLRPGNLVPSQKMIGKRACLACDRARAWRRVHPESDFEEVADLCYRHMSPMSIVIRKGILNKVV